MKVKKTVLQRRAGSSLETLWRNQRVSLSAACCSFAVQDTARCGGKF